MSPGLPNPSRVKVTVVALVAASGGLMAAYGGASVLQALAATLAALVVGVALVAYLSWIVPTADTSDRDLRRR